MEILFRGRRNDGMWVRGTLHVCGDGRAYIINGTFEDARWDEINPDTASMYTGIRDKHGAMIFDGDVVRMLNQRFLISWGAKNARFELHRLRFRCEDGSTKFLHTKDLPEGTVIGNRWDDPSLLQAW